MTLFTFLGRISKWIVPPRPEIAAAPTVGATTLSVTLPSNQVPRAMIGLLHHQAGIRGVAYANISRDCSEESSRAPKPWRLVVTGTLPISESWAKRVGLREEGKVQFSA